MVGFTEIRERDINKVDRDDRYYKKHISKIESLKHYFGDEADEWIDMEYVKFVNRSMAQADSNRKRGSNPPLRCPKCFKAWAGNEYLDQLLFRNVPLHKEICKDCRNA